MRKSLVCVFISLCCFNILIAQNRITEIGAGFGFSLPVIEIRNPDLDRPSAGAMFGLHGHLNFPLSTYGWYGSTGIQFYGFYFSNSPLRDQSGRAVKLFGYSLGIPLRLQRIVNADESTSFRFTTGVIPIMETSSLVRTDVKDGGIRFNVAPEVSIGMLLSKRYTISFNWFMPIILSGAKSLGNTYRLHNFSFRATYCLKGKHF